MSHLKKRKTANRNVIDMVTLSKMNSAELAQLCASANLPYSNKKTAIVDLAQYHRIDQ